jgi:sulfite exporter TauE/SafE
VEILAGFAFGFVGSLHCIGMCGPIVLALPVDNHRWSTFAWGRFLYNLGRVVTYTLMGGAVGLLGAGILFPLFQQNLSIIAGIFIILSVVVRRLIRLSWPIPPFVSGTLQRLQAKIATLLKEQSVAALFLLGVLNGLLPCGFVYVAMTGAAVSAHVLSGMLFMAGFGFGTIPAMAGFSAFPRMLSVNVRARIVKILPAFTLLVGILLVLRGLNLGIPFISPRLGADPSSQTMQQHH